MEDFPVVAEEGEAMGPLAATTAAELSFGRGAGMKLEMDGGPLYLPAPQSLRIWVQKFSQLKQFLLPVGPAEL